MKATFLGFVAWASLAFALPRPQLAIWCEFMPYQEVLAALPMLARYECDLLLHVGPHEVGDPDLAAVYREADRLGLTVYAWFLHPYEEHLYVGEDTVEATERLARRFVDWAEQERLPAHWVVFDCEPSPLLGRELFAHVRRLNAPGLARTLRREKNLWRFARSAERLRNLIAELHGRGVCVMGSANRVFLDFLRYGNVTIQDALNAPFTVVPWDRRSYITYRYHATHTQYITMINRYATLARRFHGDEAALDIGLIGDQRGIPEHRERARLFGGEHRFMSYLEGMRSVHELAEVVSVALACGVHRLNLYSLEGAVHSEAGLENWLRAAAQAQPARGRDRFTPIGSIRAGLLGWTLQSLFQLTVGEHPPEALAIWNVNRVMPSLEKPRPCFEPQRPRQADQSASELGSVAEPRDSSAPDVPGAS